MTMHYVRLYSTDLLEDAKNAIESLPHITILLMDGMKANNDENGEKRFQNHRLFQGEI